MTLFPSDVQPVVIDHGTEAWLPVFLRSWQKSFPDSEVLLIDNNYPPKRELRRLEERFTVSYLWNNSPAAAQVFAGVEPAYGHGSGMDFAAAAVREKGKSFMLHLEPDCMITGQQWFWALYQKVTVGLMMAGAHRKSYGPIHPTPSLWRVSEIPCSFRQQPRNDDEIHPRFSELFDKPGLLASIADLYPPEQVAWFADNWDTAQRAWFLLATQDRAGFVEVSDFIHFWAGSRRNPGEVKHPALDQFLDTSEF